MYATEHVYSTEISQPTVFNERENIVCSDRIVYKLGKATTLRPSDYEFFDPKTKLR